MHDDEGDRSMRAIRIVHGSSGVHVNEDGTGVGRGPRMCPGGEDHSPSEMERFQVLTERSCQLPSPQAKIAGFSCGLTCPTPVLSCDRCTEFREAIGSTVWSFHLIDGDYHAVDMFVLGLKCLRTWF
jgi:hypothetical protein